MLEYILLANSMYSSTSASADAASAKAAAISAEGTAERLEMRVAALELTVETLLRFTLQNGHVTEQEFLQLLQAVDAEDGKIDGRRDLFKFRKSCPQCHRASSGDRTNCMWCGANLQSVKPLKAE